MNLSEFSIARNSRLLRTWKFHASLWIDELATNGPDPMCSASDDPLLCVLTEQSHRHTGRQSSEGAAIAVPDPQIARKKYPHDVSDPHGSSEHEWADDMKRKPDERDFNLVCEWHCDKRGIWYEGARSREDQGHLLERETGVRISDIADNRTEREFVPDC
jgi:hypothetical protein